MELFAQLRNQCSDEITARILGGIRQGGTTFECIWHPVILSWVQKKALAMAISEALQKRLRTTKEWDECLS